MTVKYCFNCGTKAPSLAAKFCSSCGTSLSPTEFLKPAQIQAKASEKIDPRDFDESGTDVFEVPEISELKGSVEFEGFGWNGSSVGGSSFTFTERGTIPSKFRAFSK